MAWPTLLTKFLKPNGFGKFLPNLSADSRIKATVDLDVSLGTRGNQRVARDPSQDLGNLQQRFDDQQRHMANQSELIVQMTRQQGALQRWIVILTLGLIAIGALAVAVLIVSVLR